MHAEQEGACAIRLSPIPQGSPLFPTGIAVLRPNTSPQQEEGMRACMLLKQQIHQHNADDICSRGGGCGCGQGAGRGASRYLIILLLLRLRRRWRMLLLKRPMHQFLKKNLYTMNGLSL